MDAYLDRFERFAVSECWERSSWATSQSSLLTGQGLDVYISLPQEESNDYNTLKKRIS